jgi:hypothetical protein
MNLMSEFFNWIAIQPAFVGVSVGVFFCLVVAPTMLAAIATAITVLERLVETRLSAIPGLNTFGSLIKDTESPIKVVSPLPIN